MYTETRAFLQSFLSPIHPETFRNELWPDEVFAIHGALERLPAPFTSPELTSFDRLASCYPGRVLFGRGTKGPQSFILDNVQAQYLYKMGLSLYLPDIEPVVTGATDFLRSFEKALGLLPGQARITLWAAPEAEGVSCHFDPEEVFSIQLHGEKRFYVAEKKALVSATGFQYGPEIDPIDDLYPQLSNGFPDPKDFEFTQVDMKPGSILFMPRGVWHYTRAYRDSMSITIAISAKSAMNDLMRIMRPLLLQDPEWRRPVYGVSNGQWQTNGERERLSRMLKNLQNVVNTLEPEDFVRGTDLPDPIQPTDRFQRIPHMQLVIDETPEALTVSVCRISDGFMTAPASISKPCRPVLEGLETANAAFSVLDLLKQFPEITLSDYQPLLSVLIGLGYLKYLAFKKNAVI